MYKFFTLIILAGAIKGVEAQIKLPIDSETGQVGYTKIINTDSVSKEELFSRAMEWIATNYKSANKVIELKDEKAGKIIVKGNFSKPINMGAQTLDVYVNHTINLSFKDGRCRIQINNFGYKYCYNATTMSSSGCREESFEQKIKAVNEGDMFKKSWTTFLNDCDRDVQLIIKSLSDFLAKPNAKDDW
jgi:Cu/Ag efflux protein CusF